MKKVAVILGLCLLSMAATCPPKPPDPCPGQPKPCPTPTPTPTPGIPLRTVGNQFSPPILGMISTHYQWPLMKKEGIDKIANAGLNYAGGRLPCTADDRGPAFELYERVPGSSSAFVPRVAVMALISARDKDEAQAALLLTKLRDTEGFQVLAKRGIHIPQTVPQFDLTKFSTAFDANLDEAIGYAESKKVYYNQGLNDGWCAVHEELPLFTRAGNNIQGVDFGYCSDFQQVPNSWLIAQTKHVVKVAGKHWNITWELGNEANRCHPSREYVTVMHQVVYDAETEFGYIHHLWSPGTLDNNSPEFGATLDYGSFHGFPQEARASFPVEVNEFSPQDKGTYLNNLNVARAKNTVYHFWCDDDPHGGEWGNPAWIAECDEVLKEMKNGPAPGCSTIPDGPGAIADDPKPPAEPILANAINTVMQRLHPECEVGSSCLVGVDAVTFRNQVVTELRKDGYCAGIQAGADEVCFGPGGVNWCQAFHCASCQQVTCPPDNPDCGCGAPYAKIGWAPGSVRDTWRGPTNTCLPCPSLGKIEAKNAGVLRVVIDATPKTCENRDWNNRCSNGMQCSPGGIEGADPAQRQACERQWGPYTWTIDGVDCLVSGSCWEDGGNPLRIVAPGMEGRTIRCTGANGVFGEVVGAHQ